MGFNTVGTGKPDSKTIYGQRPYMGFNTARQGNRLKDHRIQHSWDRKTRSKNHIWAKTIYGIQHSETGKPDPKTIGFNTVGTGKPDPKTIYGQRPYMGFNTVGTGKPDSKTIYGQRPYGIQHSGTGKPDPKTIGFNTVETGKPDPKTIYGIQHSWDRETRLKDHIWAKTIYGIQHSETGKPTQRP